MAEYIIAFICLVAGTLVGLFISMLFYKHWGTASSRKRKQRCKSKKAKTELANEGSPLRNKLADKSHSYTDFSCAADSLDPSAYIHQRQSMQDEAYNSLIDRN